MSDGAPRKRRGFMFVVKAIVVGVVIVAVVAVAGDDELRASLKQKLGA